MTWLKLLEHEIFMSFRALDFSFWDLSLQLLNRLAQLGFVRTLEVFKLLAIMECYKVGNGVNLVELSCISGYLSVDGSKNQVRVAIRLGQALKYGLDPHAWRTSLAPKVDNNAWEFFDHLLELTVALNLKDLSVNRL